MTLNPGVSTSVEVNGVTNTTTGAQSAEGFNGGFLFSVASSNISRNICIYHTTIYVGTTCVRDLYPVYRKNDNTPGYYDI